MSLTLTLNPTRIEPLASLQVFTGWDLASRS